MTRRFTGSIARLRADATAWIVLTVGIIASVAVYVYVARAVEVQQRARFEAAARSIVDSIHDRTDAYLATLRATRALFDTGRDPTREEFSGFVRGLELNRFYPGIQGIGYAKVVPAGGLEEHERAVRAEGFPGYRVWPPGPRDPYTSIVYIEPFDWRNQRAFGYDMFSEPVRRDAMERARDTGIAASSARVELVQEAGDERQPGFLIYLAVYAPEVPNPRTRQPVRGFVYAPFRAGDLLGATLAGIQGTPTLVEVFDGDYMGGGDLLYSSVPEGGVIQGPELISRMSVAGRLWTIRIAPTRGFIPPWERVLPRGVLIVGLLVSFVLFSVTRRETRSRHEAERAAGRARFLADAGKILASSLSYRDTLAEVATRAARDLMDWCVVLVVEGAGPVRLVGHRDEAAAREAAELLGGIVLDPEARFGAAAAFHHGGTFVVHEVDDASLARIAGTPETLRWLRAARPRSMITVALRARDETFGAITFVSSDPARLFDRNDVAMAEDLGRLAVAAIDIARLYLRAQQAVRLRDEFLSIASHELKTPLTSLALQTDSLIAAAARGHVPEPVARKAEVIRRNVDRLARLISNLLDISRIGAGRLVLDLEDVDLGDVVREVVGRFQDEAARVGCTLHLEGDASVVGHWDRLRLDQVITNLVANAVKYGPGGPVTVAVHGEPERALLTVRDEGIGIPLDAQERIFERFERAVPARHYGGFGLGLWIVRRIVEALGGTISVESDPGHGATFTVVLKREAARRPEPREAREASGPTQPGAA